MKRDMDLIRLILLKIEEEYQSEPLYDLEIENYDMETIAYHCQLLYDQGLISDYKPFFGDDSLIDFAVRGLTQEGYDLLEKIRDNSLWGKIKLHIKETAPGAAIELLRKIVDTIIA